MPRVMYALPGSVPRDTNVPSSTLLGCIVYLATWVSICLFYWKGFLRAEVAEQAGVDTPFFICRTSNNTLSSGYWVSAGTREKGR